MEDTPEDAAVSSKFPFAGYILLCILSSRTIAMFMYKSIVSLYLRNKLLYTTDEAISLIHGSRMIMTFFMPLGALTVSSLTNRFNILVIGESILSVAYCLITTGSLPMLRQRFFIFVFWILQGCSVLITAGAFHAFGGDQFKLPEQQRGLRLMYGAIYIVQNICVLLSFYLGPLLKTEIACFGEQDCYTLGFGLGAIFCIIQLVILISSTKIYIKKKATEKIILKFFMCIGTALKLYVRERKSNPQPHWLDHAKPAYGAQLVDDIKRYFQILTIIATLPVFYAVYNQTTSKWLFQSTRMDGRVSSYTIIPDHYQLLNPFLVLVLVPLVTHVLDPITKKMGTERLLRRTIIGGSLLSISFMMSGVLETYMKQSYPVIPNENEFEIRIFNTLHCDLIIEEPDVITASIELVPMSSYTKKNIPIRGKKSITLSGSGTCANFRENTVPVKGGSAKSICIQMVDEEVDVIDYEETIQKSETGFPLLSVVGASSKDSVFLEDSKGVKVELKSVNSGKTKTAEAVPETYKLLSNGKAVLKNFRMHLGGVYSVVTSGEAVSIFEIVEPNNVHIFWILPQTIVMTLGEVYFSVALIEFLYSEAPVSLKQVVLATQLFANGLGDGLIVLLTAFGNLDQDYEFYLSAFVLIINLAVMIILGLRFKPINPEQKVI